MEYGAEKERIGAMLRHEIAAMVKVDQTLRSSGEMDPEVDRANIERFKRLVEQYGWPTKGLVGEEAAHGAWLLVQHADHDIAFQEQCLAALEEAAMKGEAEAADAAYLTDRIRVAKGEPQVYGTQFRAASAEHTEFEPIDDAENVDARRRAVGLEPLDAYAQGMRDMLADLDAKKRPADER